VDNIVRIITICYRLSVICSTIDISTQPSPLPTPTVSLMWIWRREMLSLLTREEISAPSQKYCSLLLPTKGYGSVMLTWRACHVWHAVGLICWLSIPLRVRSTWVERRWSLPTIFCRLKEILGGCSLIFCVSQGMVHVIRIMENLRRCHSVYVNGKWSWVEVVAGQMQMSYPTLIRNFFQLPDDDT